MTTFNLRLKKVKAYRQELSDKCFSGVCSTLRAPIIIVGDGAAHLDHGASQTLADDVVTCDNEMFFLYCIKKYIAYAQVKSKSYMEEIEDTNTRH